MLLLPRMTGGGGFIGDIPRGGLGEEAATLDRLLALTRFSPNPMCGSFIVRTVNRSKWSAISPRMARERGMAAILQNNLRVFGFDSIRRRKAYNL
jgi:hypothetical protein